MTLWWVPLWRVSLLLWVALLTVPLLLLLAVGVIVLDFPGIIAVSGVILDVGEWAERYTL